MSDARREAFLTVSETCPAVDSAASKFKRMIESEISDHLDDLIDSVKEQTESLRAALIDAIDAKKEAEARAKELESLNYDLEREVASLKSEIEKLEAMQ